MIFPFYFTKGVDRRYPERWYLSAAPNAQVVQYFSTYDAARVRDYLISLGFKPGKSFQYFRDRTVRRNVYFYDNNRNLFIRFRSKADEAHFIMLTHDGIYIPEND